MGIFSVVTRVRRVAQWAGLLAGLLAGVAFAQGQGQLQVLGPTLAQALDAAWARSPQALALQERREEAQATGDVARRFTPGPGAVSVSHLTDRFNRNDGRREWEVEVATPVWLPGQRLAQQNLADRLSGDLEGRTQALRWQLAQDVREAWWAVALARQEATLAHERADTARALEASVNRRYRQGDLARLDANLAQNERLSADAEALAADSAQQQAEGAYRNLVGEAAPAQLSGESTQPAPDLVAHPLLRSLQAAVDLARSRLAWADTSRRDAPEVALRWNTQRGDSLAPADQAVGVKVTIPFSSDGRVRQGGAAARAELAQAEAELSLAQERVARGIRQAEADWQMAQTQLTLAAQRRAATADNLALAQRAFELGELDLPALLRARADAREAQAWGQRQETAHRRALSRLHQAQGVMP